MSSAIDMLGIALDLHLALTNIRIRVLIYVFCIVTQLYSLCPNNSYVRINAWLYLQDL